MFLYHFDKIYGTNLLTRCAVPVPVFCCFFVSEKFYSKYPRNFTGQKPRTLFLRHKDVARRGPAGGQPPGQTRARRGPPYGRAWGVSGGPRLPPTPPLRPYNLRRGKTLSTREEIHEEFRQEFWHIFLEWFCYPNRKAISVFTLIAGSTGPVTGTTDAPPSLWRQWRHCHLGRTPPPAPSRCSAPPRVK